jgi:hypothetical protein
MSIRLIFRLGSKRRPPSTAVAGIFTTSFAPPPRPWPAMFGSLAAHGLILVLTVLVADHMAREYEGIDWSAYKVEIMRLRVPEAIFYVPAGAAAANGVRNTAAATRPAETRPASPRTPGATRALIGLELPPIKPLEKNTTAAVLQPSPLDSRPGKLPSLAFWARTAEHTPKRDQIRVPGSEVVPTTPPSLAAPPVLAIPNRETDMADVNIGASPPVAMSSLPLPPSSTSPVRDQLAAAKAAAFDRSSGVATNVISISADRVRSDEVVSVPPGSSGSGVLGDGLPATGNSRTAGPSSDGQSRRAGEPSKGNGDASSSQPLTTGRTSAPLAAAGVGSPGATAGADALSRIMHPPNGNFDVVVTQSAEQAELPGFPSRLSGNPVYSVYLPVGDVTEWVLTFCLPARKDRENSRYQVYIDDAGPLSPPYPVTTTIPQSIVGETRRRPLAFRGLLSAEGTLREITASETSLATRKIATALSEWKFRPAKRNNTPTEVEILLLVGYSSN